MFPYIPVTFALTQVLSLAVFEAIYTDLCPCTCTTAGQINHHLAALSPIQINDHKMQKDGQVEIM